MRYYDKLIFELSRPGRSGFSLPEAEGGMPREGRLWRSAPAGLPEVSEPDVVRHYTNLSQMNFGVDTGFYPLGSCTMKYNPKINEEIASMPGFTGQHPLQPEESVRGTLSELSAHFGTTAPRGEIVVVVAGRDDKEDKTKNQ